MRDPAQNEAGWKLPLVLHYAGVISFVQHREQRVSIGAESIVLGLVIVGLSQQSWSKPV